jgi:hypothetical protein
MSDENFTLTKKVYDYIRLKAQENDSLDQIDVAYICGLLEGLLVKNGYHAEEPPKPFKITDIFNK